MAFSFSFARAKLKEAGGTLCSICSVLLNVQEKKRWLSSFKERKESLKQIVGGWKAFGTIKENFNKRFLAALLSSDFSLYEVLGVTTSGNFNASKERFRILVLPRRCD